MSIVGSSGESYWRHALYARRIACIVTRGEHRQRSKRGRATRNSECRPLCSFQTRSHWGKQICGKRGGWAGNAHQLHCSVSQFLTWLCSMLNLAILLVDQ